MNAALSTRLVICKAGQLRTTSTRQSTSLGAARPSIFRNTSSQRDSLATFSLGGGELPNYSVSCPRQASAFTLKTKQLISIILSLQDLEARNARYYDVKMSLKSKFT